MMKRLMVLAALVLVIALGSYAIFAQPSSSMMQGGSDSMMAGGIGGGLMGDMGCSGSGMMQMAMAATSDGGVIVAAAGKLIKYDASPKKVSEVDVDIDWNAVHKKMPQSCPMGQMMK